MPVSSDKYTTNEVLSGAKLYSPKALKTKRRYGKGMYFQE